MVPSTATRIVYHGVVLHLYTTYSDTLDQKLSCQRAHLRDVLISYLFAVTKLKCVDCCDPGATAVPRVRGYVNATVLKTVSRPVDP